MTASSGPGLSLMQEGISYLAGAELPCVIADIMRGGPGLGNIGPEQGDYNQMVKGGGHGNYHTIVYAPAYAQEMCDFTLKAFAAAQAYRTPAILLADGFVGQMMEPVRFPETAHEPPRPDWAVRGDAATRPNLITSIYMSHEDLEAHNRRLMAKYARAAAALPEHREYLLEDAEVLLVGYGIVGRVLRSVVDLARREGIKAGLFRPVTLWPFPEGALGAATARAKRVLVVELSDGQMVHDVRLAAGCRLPIGFYGRQGGMVPTPNEILEVLRGTRKEHHVYG
jgi:pyruvate/2-oxoacid:ferredoxin oxidoreductase alpha subunit